MRNLPRAMVLAAAILLTTAGCGSSDDGSGPAGDGPRAQAVERLHQYGLTTAQARCVVDEVGADAVVASDSIDAFVQGQQYQDAAAGCVGDG